MGWFDSKSSAVSSGGNVQRRSSPTPSSHSIHNKRSKNSKSGYSTHHTRTSAPSFISGLGGSRAGARSNPSVFSSFSSSSRRARPRDGFVQRMLRDIKRLFRDIYRWARRNPVKVFMLVILPLLTSGVLPKLLAMIGIRLPRAVTSALGGAAKSNGRGGRGVLGKIGSLGKIAKIFA
ncbi:oxidase [Penicillium digitatum]|uniref:Uncharacterized protein n=3 Tax=Penicillium digitatum TaxID=36651 RepID=K9G5T1_PEND2|nr:hypothetical protein PDIP_68390 [Penicillium digitatum Pd1]EKV08547.1 hypothetical protein PDIP_68390 [Penicillium digitatum Pd1]EKV10203.1 hypothetical protein PDIG_58940 [Penicillium digitatum PHI26]KAG0158774.1 hypothetical protein PDIDSM_6293 [Penicillium digitatum]QQK41733.1 oxidase [Penicillium digitatum]